MTAWCATALLMLLIAANPAAPAGNERREEEEEFGGGRGLFLLEKSKQVVKTEAGEVKVVKGFGWKGGPSPMHLGFISMEPNSLYVPQYMDSSLILFVRRGEAKVGWIYKDRLVEKQLKIGDIYRIPAGSTFYIANTGRGQRLQMISSIDTSESLGYGVFQSFFISGGSNPTSVLAGFDSHTLATAFNISSHELEALMRRGSGPIVYTKGEASEQGKRLTFMMQATQTGEEEKENKDGEGAKTCAWRKLLNFVLWKKERELPVAAPHAYNLYQRTPDFKNDYGWSIAVGEDDYAPLKHARAGVFLYGVVLSGAGSVQVVFPNGSLAMNAEVAEGDVFWVPRYFPFCQVASRSGPMEFFGFTTSARKNRPQFLVGAGSVLRAMMGPELAAAFAAGEDHLRKIAEAQGESTILPPWPRSERSPELWSQ
ncbi:unnamed protein product [Spirodela intermedia]|uniref:Cupin type-1 domain-containing protein n=1 Tax=Spirodela intermedia TaxID=51605 RepID=A0A7I8LA67_SPIIN|nr:unnamed protein product [Spirodela intermedia]